MNIEERLSALEDSHSVLVAEHMALLEVCRALLPLISCDPTEARQRLTDAYDDMNRRMDAQDQDAVFQKAVRNYFDWLTRAIGDAAAKRAGPKP